MYTKAVQAQLSAFVGQDKTRGDCQDTVVYANMPSLMAQRVPPSKVAGVQQCNHKCQWQCIAQPYLQTSFYLLRTNVALPANTVPWSVSLLQVPKVTSPTQCAQTLGGQGPLSLVACQNPFRVASALH